ncbi:hypothetical protein [Streptomyces fructofermentans]
MKLPVQGPMASVQSQYGIVSVCPPGAVGRAASAWVSVRRS